MATSGLGHKVPSRRRSQHVRCTSDSRRLAAPRKSAESRRVRKLAPCGTSRDGAGFTPIRGLSFQPVLENANMIANSRQLATITACKLNKKGARPSGARWQSPPPRRCQHRGRCTSSEHQQLRWGAVFYRSGSTVNHWRTHSGECRLLTFLDGSTIYRAPLAHRPV